MIGLGASCGPSEPRRQVGDAGSGSEADAGGDADAGFEIGGLPVIAECVALEPGDAFCRGDERWRCGVDRVTETADPCDMDHRCEGSGDSVSCVLDECLAECDPLVSFAQEAYIKASNTDVDDAFGSAVALSADGTTLAVGAYGEASPSTGIGGDQSFNSRSYAGAVYIFTRSGSAWRQQAYIKASDTSVSDRFGSSVALSADGNTLAVGAPDESSAATGIDGTQDDYSAVESGAVYVFTRSGSAWSQQAYVKASNTAANGHFGTSTALSADGNLLAVGARGESSAAIGVDGDQTSGSTSAAGAVYAFTRSGTIWSQEAYIKASNTGGGDRFGDSVALSADGKTLAVGASQESSAATGIGGDQSDDSATWSGAVYVFTHSGSAWSQEAYIKASNTDAYDAFGHSVALSANGNTLAVGAQSEASAESGIGGDQADDSAYGAGAVYVFTRSGSAWSQQAYVKASNAVSNIDFGGQTALSSEGDILVVGARQERSDATGIGGDQTNDATTSGAVYVFGREGSSWSQQAYVKASNTGTFDRFGSAVALSDDGATLAVGAYGEASASTGIGGDQADDSAMFAGAVYVFH